MEGSAVCAGQHSCDALRILSPIFEYPIPLLEAVILNEVKDPCILSLFFLSAARCTYFDSALAP
jgi:hypothetical protein